jgi:hypothetical protein
VTTSVLKPLRWARSSRLTVTASSLGQYSWYQRGPSPLAAATSSMVYDDAVESTIGRPRAAAARAVASSPSGCTIDCTPTGATMTGAGIAVPSTVVPRSRTVASRSMRGTMRQRSNASRLARAVAPTPALPATYQKGPDSSRVRADSSSSPALVVNSGSVPSSPCR